MASDERLGSDMLCAVDPNIIDSNGLKLAFGSHWYGVYQIGLWPGVNNQASVRRSLSIQTSCHSITRLGSSRNTSRWQQRTPRRRRLCIQACQPTVLLLLLLRWDYSPYWRA